MADARSRSWRLESHIAQWENIAACVRTAIGETAATVALVTRNSIASLWVLTELHTRLTIGGTILLVVDAADDELLCLLQSAEFKYPDAEFDTSVTYDEAVVDRMREDYARHETAGRVIRYSKQVADFLATLPLYLRAGCANPGIEGWRPLFAFPQAPAKWSGQVRIRTFENLHATVSARAAPANGPS